MGILWINDKTFHIGKTPLRDVDTAIIEVSDPDHMVIAFLNTKTKTGEVVARIRVALLDIQTVATAVVAGAKDKGIALPDPHLQGRDEPPTH